MRAILLAAGEGTRLRPFTDHTPKCLLPIAGEPMLKIWLDRCRDSSIDRVLINIHAHAAQVREFLDQLRHPVAVTVSEEHELLGSGGTLAVNRQWVEAESEFWVLYGDVLTTMDLNAMAAVHRRTGLLATIATYRVPDPQRCGIVEVDTAGRVTAFEEKPRQPRSNLAFAGLMVTSPKALDRLPTGRKSDIGYDLLPALVGQMAAYEVQDFLIDIGTPDNYQRAQEQWPHLKSPRLSPG